jgi:tellurite resistance protein TerC
MYFLLAGGMHYFRYLNFGLSAVLIFIGLKMLGEKWVEVPTWLSLSIVGGMLAAAVGASLFANAVDRRREAIKERD